MKTPKRHENVSVPDGAQTFMQPHKLMQRDATHDVLHRQSRSNASNAGMFPVASRRFPSLSQVTPASSRLLVRCDECALPAFSRLFPPIPVCLPGDSRVPMLQLSLSPCDGVRIHPLMWASIEALKQERQV